MMKIGIEIGKDGKIIVATDGFVGESCIAEAGKVLEQLKNMGINTEMEKITYKEEYYAKERNKVANRQ